PANQLTVSTVSTEPVTHEDAFLSDSLKHLPVSETRKTSKPLFGLFAEFPDTDTPSSLLCPQATVADEWIYIVSRGSLNMVETKLFTCQCSTNRHEAEISEYRGKQPFLNRYY